MWPAVAAMGAAALNTTGSLIQGAVNQRYAVNNMMREYRLKKRDYLQAPSLQLKGLQRAGLNPLAEGLNASDFTSDYNPQMGQGPVSGLENVGTSASSAFAQVQSSLAAAKQAENQAALVDAQNEELKSRSILQYSNSEQSRAMKEKLVEDKKVSMAQASLLIKQSAEIDYQIEKLIADTKLAYQQALYTGKLGNVAEKQSSYYEAMTQQIHYQIEKVLPVQIKKTLKDIDEAEIRIAMQELGMEELTQKVAMGYMDLTTAQETFATRLDAAKKGAAAELSRAILESEQSGIRAEINDNAFMHYFRYFGNFVHTVIDDVGGDFIKAAVGAAAKK